MKITKITPISGEIIEAAGDEYIEYERFGPDSWNVRMGESWEPVYSCEELEAEYQRFKATLKTCYQCGNSVHWLAPDSRCKDCTHLTPEEISG